IAITLGFWHLFFEIRQFIYSPLEYFATAWNYFDLCAILSSIITSILWLYNGSAPSWAITYSTLFLELKFILYFRATSFVGVYFATIIGVAQSAFSFLVLLGFILFAFAHSLHLLLRPETKVSLDYPSYSSDPNDPWNLATTYNSIASNNTIEESASLIEPPDSNTNMFMWFDSSILAVYIMLTGDSSPLSSWVLRENYPLVIIMVLFSFFTTVYLMNLFITLLGNAIDETTNKAAFLTLRAEIFTVEVETTIIRQQVSFTRVSVTRTVAAYGNDINFIEKNVNRYFSYNIVHLDNYLTDISHIRY
ncbi:2876_t:CDS:2, partial [Ambispora leptoticha]